MIFFQNCLNKSFIFLQKSSHFCLSGFSIALLISSGCYLIQMPPSEAETCTPFPVIGGEGTEVTKTVSQPRAAIPIPGPMSVGINNNWNTDFAIIPLKQYRHYLIDFTAKNEGDYRIRFPIKLMCLLANLCRWEKHTRFQLKDVMSNLRIVSVFLSYF